MNDFSTVISISMEMSSCAHGSFSLSLSNRYKILYIARLLWITMKKIVREMVPLSRIYVTEI